MPYFFVADNIFALQKHLMKPYSRKSVLNHTQKVFNYRITRARINIECAFGLLERKWAVLQKDHAFNLQTFQSMIIALLCLHNMFITHKLEDGANNDLYQETMQEEGDEEMEQEDEFELNMESVHQRNILAKYFVSEGSVSWQDAYI